MGTWRQQGNSVICFGLWFGREEFTGFWFYESSYKKTPLTTSGLLSLLLNSIYRLGLAQEQKQEDLVTPLYDVKHLVGMIFENKNGLIKYDKSELHNFNPDNQGECIV